MKKVLISLLLCLCIGIPVCSETVYSPNNAFSFSANKTVFSSGESTTLRLCQTVEVGANQSLTLPSERYMAFRIGAENNSLTTPFGSITGTPTVNVFPSSTYQGGNPGNVSGNDLDITIANAVNKVVLEYDAEDAKHFVTGDIVCVDIAYTAPTVSVLTTHRVDAFNNIVSASMSQALAITFTINP